MTTIYGPTLTAAALAIMTILAIPPARTDDRPQNACDASCRLASDSIVKSNQEVKAVSDKRVTTYDTYLSAWSAMPDEERRRLLRESVTQDVVFTNPMQTRVGLEPVTGKTVWHISNGISEKLFELVLADFARSVGAGEEKRIVLQLNNAGWHRPENLTVPLCGHRFG